MAPSKRAASSPVSHNANLAAPDGHTCTPSRLRSGVPSSSRSTSKTGPHTAAESRNTVVVGDSAAIVASVVRQTHQPMVDGEVLRRRGRDEHEQGIVGDGEGVQLVERGPLVGGVSLGVPHRQLHDDDVDAGPGELGSQLGEQVELAATDDPHARIGARVGDQPGAGERRADARGEVVGDRVTGPQHTGDRPPRDDDRGGRRARASSPMSSTSAIVDASIDEYGMADASVARRGDRRRRGLADDDVVDAQRSALPPTHGIVDVVTGRATTGTTVVGVASCGNGGPSVGPVPGPGRVGTAIDPGSKAAISRWGWGSTINVVATSTTAPASAGMPRRSRTHVTRWRIGSSTSQNEAAASAVETAMRTSVSAAPSSPVRSLVNITYTGQCHR